MPQQALTATQLKTNRALSNINGSSATSPHAERKLYRLEEYNTRLDVALADTPAATGWY